MCGEAVDWNLDFVLDSTGDGLKEVQVTGEGSYNFNPKVMAMMEERRHDLSHIRLLQDWTEHDTRNDMTKFLRDLLPDAKNLRDLFLDLTYEHSLNMWDAIPMFPLLSRLSFCCLTAEPSAPWSNQTLTSLTILIRDAQFFRRALKNVAFTSLREFELTSGVLTGFSAEVFRLLLRSIITACTDSPLTSLLVRTYDNHDINPLAPIPEDPDTSDENILGLDDLRPLMKKYPTLEVLHLGVGLPWALHDDAIREVVSVWGRGIRSLRLDPNGGWTTTKCATFAGLEHIAMHCPRLTTLGLYFVGSPSVSIRSATVHIDANRQSTGHYRNEALRDLYVGCSPLDPFTVNDMAMYLSMRFPNLETIKPAERMRTQLDPPELPTNTGDRRRVGQTVKRLTGPFQRWEMVEDIVPVIGLARKQERLALI